LSLTLPKIFSINLTGKWELCGVFSTHNLSNPEVLKEHPSGIFSSLHSKYGTNIEVGSTAAQWL
jgi:hypothetical protein